MPPDDEIRERVVGFFRLLKEFEETRLSTVTDIDKYLRVLWFHEIPKSGGSYARTWGPQEGRPEDVWVEVSKLPEPPCPAPPRSVEPWLEEQPPFDSDREPDLLEQINVSKPGSDDEYDKKLLADHPKIQDLWLDYLEKWEVWADKHRKWKAHHGVYASLFTIHQEQRRLGEQYELVLAIGLLVWKSPSGKSLRRHILTTPASLEFDADQGVFTVGPTSEGISLSLELEMIPPEDRPPLETERGLEGTQKALEGELWEKSCVDGFLRSVVQSLDDLGEYDESVSPPKESSGAPRIFLAPALVLRPRSRHTVVKMLETIVSNLEDTSHRIPENVRLLGGGNGQGTGRAVAPELSDDDLEPVGEAPTDSRLYFPLPSNKEQSRIVATLSKTNGLLVQGPPGTGKSHTIVNLVCHLLAQGKRVLVTAQNPRALKVLHSMLPQPVRPLCVSRLGKGRRALDELEASVYGINDHVQRRSKDSEDQAIKDCENRLEQLSRERAEVENLLTGLRESEIHEHEVAGYNGTAQEIARQTSVVKDKFEWLEDEIPFDSPQPLTLAQFSSLHTILDRLDESRRNECSQHSPDPDKDLPAVQEFEEFVQTEKAVKETIDRSQSVLQASQASALSSATREVLHDLVQALDELLKSVDTVKKRPVAWIEQAVHDILADDDTPWKDLKDKTERNLAGLRSQIRSLEPHEFAIPEGLDRTRLKADARDLRAYIQRRGKPGFWASVTDPVVKRTKYLRTDVFVDGRPSNTAQGLSQLISHLDTETRITFLWDQWRGIAEPIDGPVSRQAAKLEEHLEALENVVIVDERLRKSKRAVDAVPGLLAPSWHIVEEVRNLKTAAAAIVSRARLSKLENSVLGCLPGLRESLMDAGAHPLNRDLLEAIETRAVDSFIEVITKLDALHKDRSDLRLAESLLETLRALAPQLASALRACPLDSIWADRLQEIHEAWNWAQGRTWLSTFFGDDSFEEVNKRLASVEKEIEQQTAELAALKAWKFALERLSASHLQHLMAWKDAVKRIGKGTGKHAPMHYEAARRHLNACSDAIPAWIMPLYMVFDTIDPRANLFDVVIVDEASQCGLDALILLYLARQIIIVGDDEQISPTVIRMDHAHFRRMVEKHLPDFPLSTVLHPDTSLFDLGTVWFRSRIVLREHFRCMPEIIRFSNNLCYQNAPLIPLRQYPPDRLDPVRTVFVGDGFTSGFQSNRLNKSEAEKLVEVVCQCCEDRRYDNKSMGVISLLGGAQSKYIQGLLIERLGPEEIEKRGLVCGNAYSFQGDERDVIFLSLVISASSDQGPQRPRALTRSADKQRFNVAASRAKDQLWLFHSVTLTHLQNPEDVRRRLLEHCLHPERPLDHVLETTLEELEQASYYANRRETRPPAPFDSWFEVDVFLRLSNAGYLVRPQFPFAGYRIDLVVEGDRPRLAVECDGDWWHGPERYREDLERQRQLERAGWTFWRIRGSEFYARPDAVLKGLFRKLDSLKICAFEGAETPAINTSSEELGSDHADETATVQESGSIEQSSKPVAPASILPFSDWEGKELPDPRTAPIESLIPGLEEIIATEGPILDLRVYRLFASSAGIKRLREPTKERLTQGLDATIRYGSVEESFELGCRVLRKKGRPMVVLRTRGTRDLREIPPSEVQQMMRFVVDRAPGLEGEQVFREVIGRFEVGRLTESARGFLQKVYASLEEDLAESRGDNYSAVETSGAADLVRFPSGEHIDQLRVVLQPYRSWEAHTLTDPRTAATDEIIRGLVEIISVEGPMLPYRAYQIFARSAGIARVRQPLRERFDECLDRAVAIGKIVDEWQMTERVVRLPEVPSVILRERGPRTFHEISPGEVAELVTQIQKSGIRQGRTELYGNVREYLKLGRLSTRIRESLDVVLDSLDSSEETATDA